MTDIRKVMLIPGLLTIVALAAYMATKLDAQAPVFGDFSNAAVAEVRDSQGQVGFGDGSR
jgi:hypothetical protein